MDENVRDNIKKLMLFTKVNSSLFNLNYNDDAVYKELDKITSMLGDMNKFSASVNNILTENLLKRVVADLFIEIYGESYTMDEKIVNIEHVNGATNNKIFFTISRIDNGREWGDGYIYSIRDGSIV